MDSDDLRKQWAAFGGVTFRCAPTKVTLLCGAVHPDRHRMASCERAAGHDGYHATGDERVRWQTADVSKTGGVSCVTIDKAGPAPPTLRGLPQRAAALEDASSDWRGEGPWRKPRNRAERKALERRARKGKR